MHRARRKDPDARATLTELAKSRKSTSDAVSAAAQDRPAGGA